MDFIFAAAEQGHHDPGFGPYIVGAIAAAFFVTLGVVTHSYRDVANRHSHKFGNSTQNTSGHH